MPLFDGESIRDNNESLHKPLLSLEIKEVGLLLVRILGYSWDDAYRYLSDNHVGICLTGKQCRI